MSIKLNEEEIKNLKDLYINQKLSTHSIGKIINISSTTIAKILKNKGVELRKSGQQDLGGKSVADRKYSEKNKEKRKTYYKEWAKDNADDLKVKHGQWRDDNRIKLNEYKREYEKAKKDSDPHYKFATYTRTAIWETLKTKRGTGIFKHMPYTVNELISHIEKQFVGGMTWDNYGDWHLDHILPISSFTFDSYNHPEFLKCWSLTNLQPLWATTREIDGILYIGNLNKNCRY